MSRVEWHGDEYIEAMQFGLDDAVNAYGLVVQQTTQRNLSKGGGSPLSAAYRSSRAGGFPHLFTGALARSITLQPSTGGQAEAYVGTNLRYAKGLELGITISAKTTKYLPIPLNPAARRIQSDLSGRSLRTRSDLSPLKLKDGRLFLVRNKGKGQPPEFLFRLKESVRIAKRPYLNPSLRQSKQRGEAKFGEAFGASVHRRFLARVGGTP